MGNRYSRIRRGAQYNEALTNYITHLSTPRVPNLNSQGPRNLNKTVYVNPFKIDIAADELARAKMNPDHFVRLGARVNAAGTGGSVEENLGANSIVALSKFRAARVVLFHNATRTVTVETSEVTRQRYLKYAGDRFSCPFGRNLENDDEADAFLGIRAAIEAAETGDIVRVSWTREKVSTAT
ncbi:MAG: hypothetical protein ACFB0C_10705 [Leptolyngbyaceae cyanobacterium]